MYRLKSSAFGLAAGLLWALAVAGLTLLATYAGYGVELVELMGTIYWGVEPTWMGALIALPWAFVDGFIGGFLLAWIYNRFA